MTESDGSPATEQGSEQQAHSDLDVEEFYAERIELYRELNAHDATADGYFVIDCPGECGRPMHLGAGWRGCKPPACPDCNETADEWTDDPRVSDAKAESLKADEANVERLVKA
jgi:hypothetical protein